MAEKKEVLMNVDIRVGITEVKTWSSSAVVSVCKSFKYYTNGDTEAYEKMLARVDRTRPTIDNLYKIALNIYNHSEFDENYNGISKLEKIGYIMENLEKLAVHITYELAEEIVSDEDENGETAEVTYKEARPVEKKAEEPKAEAKPEVKPEPKKTEVKTEAAKVAPQPKKVSKKKSA